MHYTETKHPKDSFLVAIFMLIAGLLLGTVFTVGEQFWNKDIERNDCIRLQTQFESYACNNNYEHINIKCKDGNTYGLNNAGWNSEVVEQLDKIEPGQTIILLLHPNSHEILEFQTSSGDILKFSKAINSINFDRKGFFILGIIAYVGGLYGLYYVIIHIKRKCKKNIN